MLPVSWMPFLLSNEQQTNHSCSIFFWFFTFFFASVLDCYYPTKASEYDRDMTVLKDVN